MLLTVLISTIYIVGVYSTFKHLRAFSTYRGKFGLIKAIIVSVFWAIILIHLSVTRYLNKITLNFRDII